VPRKYILFSVHVNLIQIPNIFFTSEDVASLSQEVICLHESLIPIPRWKRYGVIVDRIIESIQCLRTLAQAQRNEELSMTTRLICGYLSLISTWDKNASGFISNLEVQLSDRDTWKYIIGESLCTLGPTLISIDAIFYHFTIASWISFRYSCS
jgi:hypothetical protein